MEKLLVLLDDKQRKEAAETIISRMGQNESAVKHPCATRSVSVPFQYEEQPLTEIQEDGGFSNTISTIADLEPDANVNENGFTVSRNNVQEAESDIIAWLNENGF